MGISDLTVVVTNETGVGMMGFGIGHGQANGRGYGVPWWMKAADSEKWPERGFGMYIGRSGDTPDGYLTLG